MKTRLVPCRGFRDSSHFSQFYQCDEWKLVKQIGFSNLSFFFYADSETAKVNTE